MSMLRAPVGAMFRMRFDVSAGRQIYVDGEGRTRYTSAAMLDRGEIIKRLRSVPKNTASLRGNASESRKRLPRSIALHYSIWRTI